MADAVSTLKVDADFGKLNQGAQQADQVVKKASDNMERNTDKVTQSVDQLGATAEKTAQRMSAADKIRMESEKRLTAVTVASAKERVAASQAELKSMDSAEATRKRRGTNRAIRLRNEGIDREVGGRVELAKERGNTLVRAEEAKRETAAKRLEYRKDFHDFQRTEREKTAVVKREAKERLQAAYLNDPAVRLGLAARAQRMAPSALFQQNLNQSIALSNGRQQQAQLVAGGMSGSAAWQQMMNAATARANAANANFFAGQNIPPTPPRRTGGSFGRGGFGVGGRIIGGLASGLGIGTAGLGAYAAIQGGRAIIEATKTATAYDRQRVAAESLAGSQQKLNELLDAYSRESGGVVDKVTELSNVTRLLATGFADSVPEVERFVRATRGASIALGKPQDYVIQETQLAISNTSQKRLDQIGLGIREVTDRIEKLRATNKNWARETAFQEAVLGLMDEKYGKLTSTLEGQATGVEKLSKAWTDLNLVMGQSASGPVNNISGFLAQRLSDVSLQQQVFDKVRTDPSYKPDINASPLEQESYRLAKEDEAAKEAATIFWTNARRWLIELAFATDLPEAGPQFREKPRDWLTSASGSAPTAPVTNFRRFGEEAAQLTEAAYDQELQIIKNAGEQRNSAIEQYEKQRASLIDNYHKQVAREEEDFYRQRVRGLRDYERNIMEVLRDARDRETEMREDLDDTIADAREDSEERISELQEDYNKEREKAEKEHRDTMLKAAGQLDAIAVLEERKRWKKENEEREEGHKEALEEAREDLQEQIDEAREAYEERLEDARKADEKRLEDMRVNRAQQLADEDEDRALRNARRAEDHADQLEELDTQHAETLQRIKDEAEKQRTALEEALAKDLVAVGVYVAGYLEKIEQRDKAIDHWFNNVITTMERKLAEQSGGRYSYNPVTGPQIPLNYGASLLSSPSAVSSGGTDNRRQITIESLTINAFGEGNDLRDTVEEVMVDLMENPQ